MELLKRPNLPVLLWMFKIFHVNGLFLETGYVSMQSADGQRNIGFLKIKTFRIGVFERTLITGLIYGLSEGQHGFHVHRDGRLTNNCLDAGPHFNPANRFHGSQSSSTRHVGDLGNIYSNGQIAKVFKFDSMITLNQQSPNNINNRAVVVHAQVDDLGVGGNQGSLTTGNAGGRLGCGIIQTFRPFGNTQLVLF